MCGINVIYAFAASAAPVDREELIRTRDFMRSRGPDGAGEWLSGDGRIGMAHRRLAIIDLSDAAAQPMRSRDGRYTIVFNGEIYNYRELRAQLESDGAIFTSHSDTEVLLNLYARLGAAMLDELRGMFAFAIWDEVERRIFLARDPYGIKPLYYSNAGGTFRAASQVKALIAGGRVSRTTDPAGLTGFLLRGSIPEPFTMYAGIRSLPSGHWMMAGETGPSTPMRYFSISAILREAADLGVALSTDERQEIIRSAVAESVRDHLVADVPVGAFLSGGKDSSTITALAHEAGADIQTVTMGFHEYRGRHADEVPVAAETARWYGVPHTVRYLTRDDFLRGLPQMLEAMDQPSIDAFNSYFVSRTAAELGLKVVLSGTGGDELFGGYSTFHKIPKLVRQCSIPTRITGLGKAFRLAYSSMIPLSPRLSPKTAGTIEYGGTYPGAYLLKRGLFMPWEIASIAGEELAQEGLARLAFVARVRAELTPDPGTPFGRVAALESSFFMRDQLLRDIDWASLAHSLEVRVPLVDARLLRAVAPAVFDGLAGGKNLLVRSPARVPPPAVTERKKSGFTVPVRQWLFDGGTKMFGMREWALQLCRPFLPQTATADALDLALEARPAP
ncbi:MAG TPA: asparagine synthase (glutamine-hydrolyzing) [Thermoanaerobaculia bacterium]|nr:asparagine synthase (glutamine-hydrolyzing) [Thermoanaerobaculia bacterium]